jgi:succinoglycan biosynthesis protein ExoM
MTAAAAGELQGSRVAVCICTYRRPQGLARLLQALAEQRFTHIPPPGVTLLVTDNEGSEQVKALCESLQRGPFAALHYLHEPRRGISYARNSCLDHVPQATDFVAMIDDDEIPAQDWLEQLLLAQSSSGAEVVIGPATPVFEPDTPQWVQQSGFFDKPREQDKLADLQSDPAAATCNALVSASSLTATGIRFHPDLALSGGEDALFFRELKRAGCRFTWARHAQVFETIPAQKARIGYMLREEFRRGNVRVFVEELIGRTSAGRPPGALREFRRALKRVFSGIGGVLGTLPRWHRRPGRMVMEASRVARGLGMLAGLAGIRNRHYR